MEDINKDDRHEPDDDDNRSGRTQHPAVLIIVAFLISLPFVSLWALSWYTTRLTEGQLVLTRTGCQALEYHGATVRYLEDATACGIDTQFRLALRARTGRVLVQTERGPVEVELSGSEVISLAYR
jgi:hypothetical protein